MRYELVVSAKFLASTAAPKICLFSGREQGVRQDFVHIPAEPGVKRSGSKRADSYLSAETGHTEILLMLPHSIWGLWLRSLRFWCNLGLLLIPLIGVVFVLRALTPPPPRPEPGVNSQIHLKQKPQPLDESNFIQLKIVVITVGVLMLFCIFLRGQFVYAISRDGDELEVEIHFPERYEKVYRAYRDNYEKFKQGPQVYVA